MPCKSLSTASSSHSWNYQQTTCNECFHALVLLKDACATIRFPLFSRQLIHTGNKPPPKSFQMPLLMLANSRSRTDTSTPHWGTKKGTIHSLYSWNFKIVTNVIAILTLSKRIVLSAIPFFKIQEHRWIKQQLYLLYNPTLFKYVRFSWQISDNFS